MAYYPKSETSCPNHLAFENAQNLAIASQTGVKNRCPQRKPGVQSTVRSLWLTTASFKPHYFSRNGNGDYPR
ncbi:hypothetical protein H6H01_34020 [Nostoc calcicola FACHB-3891]|nr:hypothetical protein [Nostoc calcicola FACHB-3891]